MRKIRTPAFMSSAGGLRVGIRAGKGHSTWAVALCIATLLTGPAAAQAAFPGSSGDIVFIARHQPWGAPVYSPAPPGASAIYVTNPDGTDLRPIKVGTDSWAVPEPEGFGGPTWSPDGSKIAYGHWGSDAGRIEVMDPDGSNSQPIGPAGAWAPAWSPDGSMIGFTDVQRWEAGYVMDADGGNPRLLIGDAIEAVWSPDCSRIAISTKAEDQIWIVRADGRVRILSNGHDLDWAPDGRRLVFARWGDPNAIYVVNTDGTGERRLRPGYDPAWSPDGTQIVFVRFGGLAVMNADGSNARTVAAADQTAFHYHGEPDWQALAGRAPDPGICAPWRTSFDALPRLHVSVRPRNARPEEPTRFRFRVSGEGQRRVRRAVIYFAGQRTRTNARGRAVITHEFSYNVRRRAVATKAGFRHDTATIRTPEAR